MVRHFGKIQDFILNSQQNDTPGSQENSDYNLFSKEIGAGAGAEKGPWVIRPFKFLLNSKIEN